MRRCFSLRHFITILLALSVVAVAVAQQKKQDPLPSEPSSSSFGQAPAMVLKVTTHLVIVDAIVADSSGTAVRDLKKEDFAVYEDGKRQDIQVFSFQAPDRRPRQLQQRSVSTNGYTNIPEEQSHNGALNVLLIDALNTPTADRLYLIGN